MRPPLAPFVFVILTALAASSADMVASAEAGSEAPSTLAADAARDSAAVEVETLSHIKVDYEVRPAVPRDDPSSFPVVLGSFSTTLLGSLPARTHNVRLAAAALDGVVLEPGAELSFNHRVGPRTAERGFLVAPVILREERQPQLGGGICQVASTLFDAALVAGLTPVERCRHSSPVDYIALGGDATIAWGYKDLKIRNDLNQAVRMQVEILGSTLLVRVEGETREERTYELVTEERDIPASTDANLPGHEVELYRVHLVDGREIERELVHRDLYPSARTKAP